MQASEFGAVYHRHCLSAEAAGVVESFSELQERVVLISTRDEDDFADLIAASRVIGFIPKNCLAARAIWNALGADR